MALRVDRLSRITGLLRAKLGAKVQESEARGQPSLFSRNHEDPSRMGQRAIGRKAFGSVEHTVFLTITFGCYVLLTGNPSLRAVGICRVYNSWLALR